MILSSFQRIYTVVLLNSYFLFASQITTVNFKTSAFSKDEPASIQILSIQHIKYTTHSTSHPSI